MEGGCTNCKGKTGCDDRKGDMFSALDTALERLYPSRTWGEIDDDVRFGAGVDEDDAAALAEELGGELTASTFFRPGAPDEYCNYIYILCMGREPSLVQIRDGEVAIPDELVRDRNAPPVREQYLRVCLSDLARFAAVQQVAMELTREEDLWRLTESPRAGVYDAPLLHRFQRLVTLFPAYDIVHLDFGEISAPPKGYLPGAYPTLYGANPATCNFMFSPLPATSKSTMYL
jgi:hypothetical protein